MKLEHSVVRRVAWVGLVAVLACLAATRKPATRPSTRPLATRPAATLPADGGDGPATAPAPKDDTREYEDFIRGANLETDSEVQSLLRRAAEHIEAQRYREAVTVLQHVIDRPTDTLASTDGRVFRPARAVAAEVLATLPREGRDLYRLWADGEARGIVGDAARSVDFEALGDVVRRFALSGVGDAASYRLACLALDRHDYGTARRLLAAALAHPEPSVDRAQILLRLVFACARMRDVAGAESARTRLAAVEAKLPAALVQTADREIQSLSAPAPLNATAEWPMPFGSPAREGRLAGLPEALLATNEKLWVEYWNSSWALASPANTGGRVTPGSDPGSRRAMLVSSWEERAVPATCAPVIAGDRVVFKSHDTLTCLNLKTGKLLWQKKDESSAGDAVVGRVYYANMAYDGTLAGDLQAALTDHLGRSLSVVDQRCFQVQFNRTATPRYVGAVMINGARAPQPKVAEGNVLAAHDLKTGHLLWKLGREIDEKKPFNAVRWLAAPTPCAGRILVPVEEKGELSLAALNPADGSLSWKRFLCTYASARLAYSRPVGVWVQGGEVYVASGKGVVFALDGIDGSLLWASRYEPAPPQRTATYGVYVPEGWQEDYVAAIGDLIVVAPSDAKVLLGFDRRNGKFAFSQEVAEPRYCMGNADGALIAVTGERVGRLDVAARRWAWQEKVAKNCGRGVLAGDSIYIPSSRRILKMDLKTGKTLDTLRVKTPTDDPVGNLLVYGDHLLMAGVDRVSSLASAGALFSSLDKRIREKPDARSFLERGRLHRDAGREVKYIEDLREAHQRMDSEDPKKEEVAGELLNILVAQSRSDAARAEGLLNEAGALASTTGQRATVAMARAQWLGTSGKTLQSAQAWREVASEGSDQLAPDPDDPQLKIALATAATTALRELTGKPRNDSIALAEMATAELASALAKLEKHSDRSGVAAAVAVLRSFAGTRAGAQSIAAIARRVKEKSGFESAELLLRDLSTDAQPEVAATALAALAELHQSAGWLKQAAKEWDRLGRLYPAVRVEGVESNPTGAELARQRLEKTPLHPNWPAPVRIGDAPFRCAWTVPGEQLNVVRTAPDATSQFLSEHVLLVNWRDGNYQCHALADGALKWKADLGRAGTDTPNAMAIRQSMVFSGHAYPGSNQQLPHDENVTVLRSGRSLIGLSLVNGKRLWQLKDLFGGETSPGGSVVTYSSIRGDMASMGGEMSVDDGTLVVRPTSQSVRVLDLATGATRWERQLRTNATHQVLLRNGYVLITSNTLANNTGAIGLQAGVSAPPPRTTICDRHNGRVLGEFTWDGRTIYGGAMVWTDWGVIYTTYNPLGGGDKKIIAKEFPSGKTRWTAEWKGTVVPQSMMLAGDKASPVLVVWAYMNMGAVDLATGRELWRKDADRATFNIAQQPGVSHDGKHVYTLTYGQPDAKGQMTSQIWRAISVADGKTAREVTLSQQNRAYGGMLPQPAGAVGNWLVMGRMNSTVNAQGQVIHTGQQIVTAFPLTGNPADKPQDLPGPRGKERLEQPRAPMIAVGDVLMVGHRDGISAYTGAKPRE